MRSSRSSGLLAALAAAALLWSAGVGAGEIVILESSAPGLEAGAIVDAATVVAIPAGAEVVLVEEDGSSRTVKGPFDGALGGLGAAAAVAGGGGLVGSLSKLVVERANERQVLGAVRAAPGQTVAKVFVVDIARSQTACVPAGAQPVFWRPATLAVESELTIANNAGGPVGRALWPKGEQQLKWPDSPPVIDANRYTIRLAAAPRPVAIDLRIVPAIHATPAQQADWMAAVGCRRQAERALSLE